jgi:hypothetical protein
MKEKKVKPETGLATTGTAIAKKQERTIKIDIDNPEPLGIVKTKNLDLVPEYWSPEKDGETKTLAFVKVVENDVIPDFNDPKETVVKDVAYFFEEVKKDGNAYFRMLKSASSRLVSIAKMMEKGEVYEIKFSGREKNKTNNFLSNKYEVRPVYL